MRLRVVASTAGCRLGDCPTAYLTDRGTAVVQGYVVSDGDALGELNLAAGETAVEVPVLFLVDAARVVSGQ